MAMKHPLAIALIAGLALGATACTEPVTPLVSTSPPSAATALPSQTEPSPAPTTDVLSAYKAVLLNKANFASTDDGNAPMTLDEFFARHSGNSGTAMTASQFTVIDLDHDGTPELVLQLATTADEYYGFEILHYEAGTVYGYNFVYRALTDLKADGTFSYANSADDNGIGAIQFAGATYQLDKITYCQPPNGYGNGAAISYVVNHEIATEEAFLDAENAQTAKPGVIWHDFTPANIETQLPG